MATPTYHFITPTWLGNKKEDDTVKKNSSKMDKSKFDTWVDKNLEIISQPEVIYPSEDFLKRDNTLEPLIHTKITEPKQFTANSDLTIAINVGMSYEPPADDKDFLDPKKYGRVAFMLGERRQSGIAIGFEVRDPCEFYKWGPYRGVEGLYGTSAAAKLTGSAYIPDDRGNLGALEFLGDGKGNPSLKRNIVFLVDNSGSMGNWVDVIKAGLSNIVPHLDADDWISIVTYAGSDGVALEPTRGDYSQTILDGINRIAINRSGPSSAEGRGIDLAYKYIDKHYLNPGLNRVVLITDGDMSLGTGNYIQLITQKSTGGRAASLSAIGIGSSNSGSLSQAATAGKGNYQAVSQTLNLSAAMLADIEFEVDGPHEEEASTRVLTHADIPDRFEITLRPKFHWGRCASAADGGHSASVGPYFRNIDPSDGLLLSVLATTTPGCGFYKLKYIEVIVRS